MEHDNSENWFQVDSNLLSLWRQLQTANTEEEYQAVGMQARETLISLGQAVSVGEGPAAKSNQDKTDAKELLGKYFDTKLKGSSNADLRSYCNSCVKYANALTHQRNATYTEAEICTEACAHLVVIVRIITFEESSPPMERFRLVHSASAESLFITSWISRNFNSHPVAADYGLSFKGLTFQGYQVTLIAESKTQQYIVTFDRPYWWRQANRISADALLDELFVRLLTELDKEHFKRNNQPPA